MLTLILFCTMHLVPADVTTFTIETGANQPMRCTKQPDGGWTVAGMGMGGTFSCEGSRLTVHAAGKEDETFDLADLYGEHLEQWIAVEDKKQPTKLVLGETMVQVEPKERDPDGRAGIDFVVTFGKKPPKVVPVRWEPAPQK